MKKVIILLITLCGIVVTSNIQAQRPENINGDWQNKNSDNLTVLNKTAKSVESNSTAPFPTSDLLILAVIGFFFAKKHQSLAKKHRDLAKKFKKDINPDSILNH